MKTKVPLAPVPISDDPNPSTGHSTNPPRLTKEETIWQVYLKYILNGYIDKSVGEYKCWAPEDERDLDAERSEHERLVEREKRAQQSKSRWTAWTSWMRSKPKFKL